MANVPTLRFPGFTDEWQKFRLGEYFTFKNGLNPDAKRIGRGVKFISVMDILTNNVIKYSLIRDSVEATEEEMSTYGVEYGDILFQRSSETLEDVGQAANILSFKFFRTQILEQQIQLCQRVADCGAAEESGSQIPSVALLNGAYGEKEIEGALAPVRVAQTRDTVVAGVEHKVLELMTFIHKNVVYTHLPEVNHIISAVVYLIAHRLQFRLKVLLTGLKSPEHTARHILSLLTDYIKVFLDGVQLRLQYLLLQFRRLRYLAELVVRHYYAVIVVVADVVEEADTVLRCIALFIGIQDAGIGIGSLISHGYVGYIGFQPDNHRLMHHAQTLHLVRGDAHYQCLARADLMVGYAASVLFQHPYAVLLRAIYRVYAVTVSQHL